jgi:hypothetical protein
MTTYDASGLVFSISDSGLTDIVHASGFYDWDAATNTGSWNISAPFLFGPSQIATDAAAYFFPSPYITTSFSSTSFDSSYINNNDVIQADVSLHFSAPLGNASNVTVTGTIQVQDDLTPIVYSGTISGTLTQVSSVPEPSVAMLLIAGMVTTWGLRTIRQGWRRR